MEKDTIAISGLLLIAATLGITLLYGAEEPETSGSELTNFQSEQEFIDYMNSDQKTYSSGQESARDSSTTEHSAGSSAGESGDVAHQASRETQKVEWIHTTKDRIMISHRYPRHFNSVEIPRLKMKHNVSEAGGPMVTSDNLTVMKEEERIVAYDGEMNEEWEIGLDSYVEEMTRSGDQLILLSRETDSLCPIRPYEGAEIACTSVLRPGYVGQNDYTYTLSSIDIESGDRAESMSFVASYNTQIEVSSEKTFISYSERKPEHEIMTDFILNEASVSSETRERVEELQEYDLTDRSMQIEIEAALRKYEQDNMESLEEEFSDYDKKNMRDYEDSTLLTVDNSDLSYKEEKFDGRISGIKSSNKTLLTIQYNGVDYENRAKEIRLLGGESREIEGDAQLFNGNVLVINDEELKLLDSELDELNTAEINALNIEASRDKVLASVRPEGSKRDELERESEIVLFDSELERLDSAKFDSWAIYNLNLVEGGDRSYGMVNGYNATYLLEIGEQIDIAKTKASGQLVYQEGLYTAGEKVQKINADGEIEEELDLKVPRRHIAFPEPRMEKE